MNKKIKQAIATLRQGGVGVMPTDTIYGLVGRASRPETMARLYRLRRRRGRKPFIILTGGLAELKKFKIKLRPAERRALAELWPGPVSVVLACPAKKFAYLHRGRRTLAFRLPRPKWLRQLLLKTGPLVAPSANPAGKKPATTIREAKKYFGDKIDFYAGAGRALRGKPSALVRLTRGKIKVLRPR